MPIESTKAKAKFCRDCKFHAQIKANLDFGIADRQIKIYNNCMRPFTSLVTGETESLNISCEDQRRGVTVPLDADNERGCGREGFYFQARTQES